MTYSIIGGVLAFILFLAFVSKMLGRRRITRKAHADYARCRGTRHARQLRAAIKKHESALPPFVRERNNIDSEMESLSRTEVKELRQALIAALANGPLAEVRGIGPKLRDRIVEACFDGTLESLTQAQHVQGVGEEKALDIQAWVKQIKRQMPQLLKGDFDGKGEILAAYGQRREDLVSRRNKLDSMLNTRRVLLSQARAKLAVLELVTPSTYRDALSGDPAAAERVATHTLGAFPEWEPDPKWFKDITREPEAHV